MTKQRKKFDTSFKLKVVRMIQEQGQSVPAVSFTAHGALHAVFSQCALKCVAAILATTISEEDQPWL